MTADSKPFNWLWVGVYEAKGYASGHRPKGFGCLWIEATGGRQAGDMYAFFFGESEKITGT